MVEEMIYQSQNMFDHVIPWYMWPIKTWLTIFKHVLWVNKSNLFDHRLPWSNMRQFNVHGLPWSKHGHIMDKTWSKTMFLTWLTMF